MVAIRNTENTWIHVSFFSVDCLFNRPVNTPMPPFHQLFHTLPMSDASASRFDDVWCFKNPVLDAKRLSFLDVSFMFNSTCLIDPLRLTPHFVMVLDYCFRFSQKAQTPWPIWDSLPNSNLLLRGFWYPNNAGFHRSHPKRSPSLHCQIPIFHVSSVYCSNYPNITW